MKTSSAAAMKLSLEVITLLVSDVERALRFYVDKVGFTLDVDYSPNDIGNGLTGESPGRQAVLPVDDLSRSGRSR